MKAIFNQFFGIGDILFIELLTMNSTPQIIVDWMKDNGFIHIFASGIDLNNSFMVVGELQKT